jgi:hypothetical protein
VEPRTDILVANEPAMYRGVLASELTLLRPGLPVAMVEPADLDMAVARIHPRLVICSQLTKIVRQHATASIVLYPNGANRAILDVDGQQQVLPNPDISDLLVAVDAAMERGSDKNGAVGALALM